MTDEQLLDLRICDLGLRIDGTTLERRVEKLHDELASRGLRFRPHCWLSSEWFTPDGVPGIAIPFYLAHPRLTRLEISIMKHAEGKGAADCMKILRHEAGHAIDNAYRLHRRRLWRRHFGDPGIPYPDAYSPSPYTRRFVLHIDNWYAQAHPLEDFAETFAVWLTPGSHWRERYRGWSALRKLEYVDELMEEIADRPAPVRTREQVDAVSSLKLTLRGHYEQRRSKYQIDLPDFYDRDLRRLFPDQAEDDRPAASEPAARFLRRVRRRLCRTVGRWTGAYQYNVDLILQDMIDRSDELKLRHRSDDDDATLDAAVLLSAHVMNSLYDRGHFLL